MGKRKTGLYQGGVNQAYKQSGPDYITHGAPLPESGVTIVRTPQEAIDSSTHLQLKGAPQEVIYSSTHLPGVPQTGTQEPLYASIGDIVDRVEREYESDDSFDSVDFRRQSMMLTENDIYLSDNKPKRVTEEAGGRIDLNKVSVNDNVYYPPPLHHDGTKDHYVILANGGKAKSEAVPSGATPNLTSVSEGAEISIPRYVDNEAYHNNELPLDPRKLVIGEETNYNAEEAVPGRDGLSADGQYYHLDRPLSTGETPSAYQGLHGRTSFAC